MMPTDNPQPAAATDSQPAQRVKLIINPMSGALAGAPDRLQVIVAALQAANYLPEVYLVQPEQDIGRVVKDALRRGYRLFVVCGGDGTIDSVAGALAGTRATLGIVPGGTRNNVAFSLGIPDDPVAAVGLLRGGRRLKIDVGLAVRGQEQRVFLEACSVGLLSALFPATDELQHGNLAKLGDLLGTLIAAPVAEMRLELDGQPALHTQGHIVVAANMLYVGPRFRVDPNSTLDDGLLDLVVYAELSKLDLLGSVLQAATGGAEDERIRRYQVRQVVVETDPPMPIVVDGFPLGGEGPLRLSMRRAALNIIAGPEAAPQPAATVAKMAASDTTGATAAQPPATAATDTTAVTATQPPATETTGATAAQPPATATTDTTAVTATTATTVVTATTDTTAVTTAQPPATATTGVTAATDTIAATGMTHTTGVTVTQPPAAPAEPPPAPEQAPR